jgi:hypothetical protein
MKQKILCADEVASVYRLKAEETRTRIKRICRFRLYGSCGAFVRSKLLLGAAGAEALAAQNGPSARGLEGHGIRFAALVAGNLEALTLAATARPAPRPAETGAARVATRFASFRLAQVALVVILLLSFGERESRTAFSARNLNVWHRYFLLRYRARLFGSFALRFSSERPALLFSTAALRLRLLGRARRPASAARVIPCLKHFPLDTPRPGNL